MCNRGRENLRNFSKSDFAIDVDSSNNRYVYFAFDKPTKNHRGESHDDSRSQSGRMYETHRADCPEESYCKYISHLNPLLDAFWQRPKSSVSVGEEVWFNNVPVGKNTLGTKMQTISRDAHTSKVYTNHCLRATTIQALDSEGFEARHIMSVSGHKSETSIKHYARVEESKKRKIRR